MANPGPGRVKNRRHDYRTREGKLQRAATALQLLRAEIAYATEKWERQLLHIQEYLEPKKK